MTLAAGTVEYTLGSAPIIGCGLSYTAGELESALAGPVAEIVFDDEGATDLTHHRTCTSHGEREFNDGLMAERRKQIGFVSKEQMLDLIECPRSADDLQQILIEGGCIREPEPKVKD